jgi:hypothetical protein
MGPVDEDVTETGMPRAEAALRLWLDLWDFSAEPAVSAIVQRLGVTPQEALRILGECIRQEVERDTPAMLRVAKALHG